MTLPKEDAIKLDIIGVPRNMDDATLVRQLAMPTLGEPWKCKPIGLNKNSVFGKKTVIAIAGSIPPRWTARLQVGHESAMISIELHVTPKKFQSIWDGVLAGEDADEHAEGACPRTPPPRSSIMEPRQKPGPSLSARRGLTSLPPTTAMIPGLRGRQQQHQLRVDQLRTTA